MELLIKKRNWNLIILLLSLIIVSSCKEERPGLPVELDLIIGEVGFGGSGCPEGTLTNEMDLSENEITFYFDSFTAIVGGTQAKRLDRKSCALAIPVSLPTGYKLASSKLTILGEAILPKKTILKITTEMFLPSAQGEKMVSNISGGEEIKIDLSHGPDSLLWTGCGVATTLRINTSMLLKANKEKDPAEASLNSDEVYGKMILELDVEKCE